VRPPENSANSSGATLVATTHGSIPSFADPGGAQSGTVPGEWQGAPSILPVVASSPGWYEVRLAQRPNGSTAWVLAQDVSLTTTPYRIVIDLASTHLTLWQNGRRVFSTPVGKGTSQYPTPTGHYFIALFAAPPTPAYGAFVMVTSDHSDTITDWERSGDAIIAIHGPLGSDQQIGTQGAAISHGCIRLHEPDLLRLRGVPAGSPVDIEAA
jgi:lipoprotein-anchoring transpeptidase ErfK/SrfK